MPVLGILGAFFFCTPAAHAATLYYNDHDGSEQWADLSNWWKNSGFTIQATVLPTSADNVYIEGPVGLNSQDPASVNSADFSNGADWDDFGDGLTLNVSAGATFHDTSYVNSGTIVGNVTFDDESANGGEVSGTATFNDESQTYGEVNGNATFNDESNNSGEVTGNAVFNDEGNNSGGTVDGNGTFYDSSYNSGIVSGNGTFYDLSLNNGTVSGSDTDNIIRPLFKSGMVHTIPPLSALMCM